MQIFRIKKIHVNDSLSDQSVVKKYKLLRLLDVTLMNGKETWDIMKETFDSPEQAKMYAKKISAPEDSSLDDIIEEFSV